MSNNQGYPNEPEPDLSKTRAINPGTYGQYGQPPQGGPYSPSGGQSQGYGTQPYGQGQPPPPNPNYGAPQAPPQGQQPYGAPQGQPYGAPQGQHYTQPQGSQPYGAPQGQQPYGAPNPSYGAPSPSYGAPQGQQPYGQGANWSPGVPGYGSPEYLSGSQHPTRKKKSSWLVAAIAAVLVLVVGGGGVYAFNTLSGGGTQPHEVLPGNAIAYARVDINPSAGQKLALFGFSRKFPSASERLGTGDDPRRALFDNLKQETGDDLKAVDYARDVEPWLGDRLGLAAVPGKNGNNPGLVVAVEVKDEAAARAGIPKLKIKTGFTFLNGYAIFGETQADADRYAAEAGSSPLSSNANFSEDLAALGDPGVFSFWGSLGELTKAFGDQGIDQNTLAAAKNARFVGALRFDSSYVELTGVVRGFEQMNGVGTPETVKMGTLPASTAAAISFSGVSENLGAQWNKSLATLTATPGFGQFLDQLQSRYGITLPADLQTLLGKSLTLSLDEKGLDPQAPVPTIGALLTTDVNKAQEVLNKVERVLNDSGAGVKLTRVPAGDSLAVSNSPEYAGQLAQEGALGDDEGFKLAIPEADKANFAVFVNLDKLEKLYLQSLPENSRKDLQPLRAAGVSAIQDGDNSRITLRIVVG
ncbi:DUF3352 domain-containing protein [Rhizohabitans arisaemae]|uniref:DUF3352 domain-containing protein n=1 Tax=Rhizohabitans arisaemae TaxID=2720610 RepID=UPI0024B24840|nr:DUF3352 domain-containing protein [Rhizohabitans arisaemae]